MKISMKNGKIVVDGKEFTGDIFSINDGKVIVDGVVQEGELVGDINIQVFGDVENLQNTNGVVECQKATAISTTNGTIKVKGDVTGNVTTTNGDVSASKIFGKVKTVNGDITGIDF